MVRISCGSISQLRRGKIVKEITKLEKTSQSDFALCEQSFFTLKNAKSMYSSTIVCAAAGSILPML